MTRWVPGSKQCNLKQTKNTHLPSQGRAHLYTHETPTGTEDSSNFSPEGKINSVVVLDAHLPRFAKATKGSRGVTGRGDESVS